MTEHRIEELAAEVAKEVRADLAGFGIERVAEIPDALQITFSWTQPIHCEVTLTLRDDDTDESVKDEIRRQLLESC